MAGEKSSDAYNALVNVLDAVEAGADAERLSREQIDKDVGGVFAPLKGYLMAAALEALGVELDSDGVPTTASVTRFINERFLAGSGLVLSDAFDADTTKNELKVFALVKINEQLAGEFELSSLDPDDVKSEVRRFMSARLRDEIAYGAGALLDALPDSEAVLARIAAYEASIEANSEIDDSEEAANNRERQARYRASHGRHWEAK